MRSLSMCPVELVDVLLHGIAPQESCICRIITNSLPLHRVLFSQLQCITKSAEKILALLAEILPAKYNAIMLMFNGIAQASHGMGQTGLACTHGQHLADAAGFKRAWHQEQITATVHLLSQAFRVVVKKQEIGV